MKKFIMMTVLAACLVLCAAVWPQTEAVEKTPTPVVTPVVNAPEPPVAEPKPVVTTESPAEKEKAEFPQPESPQEIICEPEPVPAEVLATPEPTPIPESEPAPTSKPTPTMAQTDTDLQAGDMVYVPGFGWLESQGPNHVDYTEDMYENGNKIGIMG